MAICRLLVLLSVGVAEVNSHASMIMPPGRNSVDADPGGAWANGKHPTSGIVDPKRCVCVNGTSECSNGQSCFWFSQGCTIGCAKCDGDGTRLPNYDHCPHESIKPTLLDKSAPSTSTARPAPPRTCSSSTRGGRQAERPSSTHAGWQEARPSRACRARATTPPSTPSREIWAPSCGRDRPEQYGSVARSRSSGSR